jgi:hypothetical protein
MVHQQINPTSSTDSTRRVFLRVLNSKRKFSQTCYIQAHDMDSYYQGTIEQSNISRIQTTHEPIWDVLKTTALPTEYSVRLNLQSNPNYIIFYSSQTVEETVSSSSFKSNIYEQLHKVQYFGTKYFEISNDKVFTICIHCLLSSHRVSEQPVGNIRDLDSDQLDSHWNRVYKNLNQFQIQVQMFGVSTDKLNSNCENRIRFLNEQTYENIIMPPRCSVLTILRKLNFTTGYGTSRYTESGLKPIPAIMFLEELDTTYNREHIMINKTKRIRVVWESYCKQRRPFMLKYFVPKQSGVINILAAIILPLDWTSWTVLIATTLSFIGYCQCVLAPLYPPIGSS